jgi:hypothetical protein
MLDVRYIDKDIDIHIGMRVGINSMQWFYSMIIIVIIIMCICVCDYIYIYPTRFSLSQVRGG